LGSAPVRITFENLSPKALLGLGDQALLSGDFTLAEAVYQKVLEVTPPASRAPVLSRLGLAQNPKPRTAGMLRLLIAAEEIDPQNAFVSDGMAMWFKNQVHLDDPRFVELVAKHRDLLPIANWHWNLGTILWALRQVADLPGDFVELGVFKGHTTLFAAEYLNFADQPRRWVLYDTFEGIPDDQVDAGWAQTNQIYKGTFSFEEVRDRFAHIPNIEVIKGRVPEALAGTCPEVISFLHVDMNNAAAEIAALDALFDRIVPGGVIVFDDYVWNVSRAQHRAESAWFEARGLVVLPLPTGQGVFVKR
jgi:O-methyltransferase